MWFVHCPSFGSDVGTDLPPQLPPVCHSPLHLSLHLGRFSLLFGFCCVVAKPPARRRTPRSRALTAARLARGKVSWESRGNSDFFGTTAVVFCLVWTYSEDFVSLMFGHGSVSLMSACLLCVSGRNKETGGHPPTSRSRGTDSENAKALPERQDRYGNSCS